MTFVRASLFGRVVFFAVESETGWTVIVDGRVILWQTENQAKSKLMDKIERLQANGEDMECLRIVGKRHF